MILKQINCRKNWASTFRRLSNYLTTELDQWEDLTHMGSNCLEANGVRTNATTLLHRRGSTPFRVPTYFFTILDIPAQCFSPTLGAISLDTSQNDNLDQELNRNVLREQHDCQSPTEQAQVQK